MRGNPHRNIQVSNARDCSIWDSFQMDQFASIGQVPLQARSRTLRLSGMGFSQRTASLPHVGGSWLQQETRTRLRGELRCLFHVPIVKAKPFADPCEGGCSKQLFCG
jgi:hypothetical protein